MFNKRSPVIYPNPQPAPRDQQRTQLFGFDRVMTILRRIKLIIGYVIISEQEVIDDRRIISWRIGNICDNYCIIVSYNFTYDNDWFTIMDSPTGVIQEPIFESLYERGEHTIGPNGLFSFDEQGVIEVLEEIEEAEYTIVL